jgi:hypothetical protein
MVTTDKPELDLKYRYYFRSPLLTHKNIQIDDIFSLEKKSNSIKHSGIIRHTTLDEIEKFNKGFKTSQESNSVLSKYKNRKSKLF